MPNWVGHFLPSMLRRPLSPERLEAHLKSGDIRRIRQDRDEHVLERIRHGLPRIPTHYSTGVVMGRAVTYFWDRDGKPMLGKLSPPDLTEISRVSKTPTAPERYKLFYGLPDNPAYLRDHIEYPRLGKSRWLVDFWDSEGNPMGKKQKQSL